MNEYVWETIVTILFVVAFFKVLESCSLDNRFYQRAFSRKIQTYIERKNYLLHRRREESGEVKKRDNKKFLKKIPE